MPSYISEMCPVCENAFEADDDIVVCPDCGTPHHRECYQKLGACANASKHGTDFEWKFTPKMQSVEELAVRCKYCGALNHVSALSCRVCRAPLDGNVGGGGFSNKNDNNGNTMYISVNKSEIGINTVEQGRTSVSDTQDTQDITLSEIRDFVGKNSGAFLFKFGEMRQKKGFNFNFFAFLFGFAYCFYRKMYRFGILVLILTLLSYMPLIFLIKDVLRDASSVTTAQSYDAFVQNIRNTMNENPGVVLIFDIAYFSTLLFCGVFFNKFYFRHIVKSIRKIRLKFQRNSSLYLSGRANYDSELRFCGGVSLSAFALSFVGMYMLLTFVVNIFYG